MLDDITILTLADRDQWTAMHNQENGLPSQSWNYAWGLSASGFEPKIAIVRCNGARMLLPFFERRWMDSVDIATIPGLSGASISPSSAAPLALWSEYARNKGWVAGYLQLDTSVELFEVPRLSYLVAHNSLFFLDLDTWDPEKAPSRTIHRKLAAARKSGAILVSDAAELAERLQALYPSAMQRLGATTIISRESLCRWASSADSFILGVKLDQVIHAVHLGHLAGDIAEVHTAATTEEGRSLATVIYCGAASYLRRRGIRFFNLGGGPRPGDGIAQFKMRLGARPTALRSIRQIYDHKTYHELCMRAGCGEDPSSRFPPYRFSGLGTHDRDVPDGLRLTDTQNWY